MVKIPEVKEKIKAGVLMLLEFYLADLDQLFI
jgi:hypothetical protein